MASPSRRRTRNCKHQRNKENHPAAPSISCSDGDACYKPAGPAGPVLVHQSTSSNIDVFSRNDLCTQQALGLTNNRPKYLSIQASSFATCIIILRQFNYRIYAHINIYSVHCAALCIERDWIQWSYGLISLARRLPGLYFR